MRATLAERLWSKVDVRGPDECWEWRAYRNRKGYGQIWSGGTNRRAPRVAWELANGPIPEGGGYHGTCVLHRCDNPPCVNPAHLFLGTQEDNNIDALVKGRSVQAQKASRDVCKRGHKLEAPRPRPRKGRPMSTIRRCLQCERIRDRRRRPRKQTPR